MPYAPDFASLPRVTYREQVLAVFGGPFLHSLADAVTSPLGGRSRGSRAAYPALCHLAVTVAARIYGSQRSALSELASDGLWEAAGQAFNAKAKTPIAWPPAPPTEKQQDAFVARLLKHPTMLEDLSDRFTRASIGLAQHLGNFPHGPSPDYANPDFRHAVFGDGTYVKPFSDVIETTDPKTEEKVILGSRSTKNQPRIQHTLTDPKPDQKTARGINHVTLSTWTRSGWVVLANAHSLSAEVHEARSLIGAVHDLLQERLHTVVWDRVLQGQDIQDFMADRRLLIVSKPVARASNSHRSCGHTAPTITVEASRDRLDGNQPLPLGTSAYPRSEGRPAEVTRSQYYKYKTLADQGCQHDLWVDDGALVTVEPDEAHWLVKTSHATAVTSVQVFDKTFGVNTTWRLPCPHDPAVEHVFDTQWHPVKRRPNSGPGKAEYDLRPLPRLDRARFAKIHGLRNITESYNAWLKARLGTDKRAMRLDPRAQFLDQICVGTLANSLTLHRDLLIRAYSR